LHRFRDIAFDMSNVAIFGYPSCVLPQTEGFPWDNLRKILYGGQRVAVLQNGIEILSDISTGCVGCTNVTADGQTTDRRNCDERNVVTFG